MDGRTLSGQQPEFAPARTGIGPADGYVLVSVVRVCAAAALHKNEQRRGSGASVPHSTWSAALRDCQIGILANCIICRDFSKGCHRAMDMGDAQVHYFNLPAEFLCQATGLMNKYPLALHQKAAQLEMGTVGSRP